VECLSFLGVYVSKKRKIRHADTDDVEKQDAETEDIYDDEQRERMLDEDEITAAENAFMQGREMKPEKRKGKKITHNDTVSVELAKEEYTED
jgi:hypothetical protein